MVLKNGSNIRGMDSGLMPDPVSCMVMTAMARASPASGPSGSFTVVRVRTVSLPPEGIASQALMTRFTITCSIWAGSATTIGPCGSRSRSSSMSAPVKRLMIPRMDEISRFSSRAAGFSTCRLLKARSWRTMSEDIFPARRISSAYSRRRSPEGISARRSSPNPSIAVRRLLKSWAMPPASRPTASILPA